MQKRERDIILRRRARFIGMALTGVGLATALESCNQKAQVCLEMPPAEPDAAPMPCLSPPPEEPDASLDPHDAGDAGAKRDAGDAGRPAPSSTAPRTQPRPCLIAPVEDDEH